MNQSQLKYARERASGIFKSRKDALKDKYTTPAVRLDDAEKLAALKAGAFTVEKKSSYYWHNSVVFKAEKPEKFDKEKHDAELAALDASYRKLTDELVLGDNEQALALLKAFEAAA